MLIPFKITPDQADRLLFATLDHPGYCSNCRELDSAAYVEPDAENRLCECCETPNLFGLEQAVLLGMVVVDYQAT